jgi:hypothetical protein
MGNSDYPNHPALARRLQAYCAGAMRTRATPTSWPPSAVSAPASAANASNAGAARGLRDRADWRDLRGFGVS